MAHSSPASEHENKPNREVKVKNLKNMTKYTASIALPRPELGAQMCRKTLNGRYEEALVTSVTAHERDSQAGWTAVLMTKNGVEFVSGDIEHRTQYDWMPKEWLFHPETASWYGPLVEVKEVEVEDGYEVIEDKTDIVVLPEPWEGEKFMTWRARAMKSDTRLKMLDDVNALLSEAWKDKSFSQGITL